MARVSAKSVTKVGVLTAFLLGVVCYFSFTEPGRNVPRQIREYVENADPFWAPLLYVLFYILGSILLLPGTLLSFAGAILFGPYLGTLYTWVGATIGATLAFLISKSLGRSFVEGLLKGRLEALDRLVATQGFTGLLILRLVPLFPFNGLNFGCGLTRIRMTDYVLATALGILPATFVFQFLFARFGEKILDEGFAWSDLLDPQIAFAAGLFTLFIALGKWLSRRMCDK